MKHFLIINTICIYSLVLHLNMVQLYWFAVNYFLRHIKGSEVLYVMLIGNGVFLRSIFLINLSIKAYFMKFYEVKNWFPNQEFQFDGSCSKLFFLS